MDSDIPITWCKWRLASPALCQCEVCGKQLLHDKPEECRGQCLPNGVPSTLRTPTKLGDAAAVMLESRGIRKREKCNCGKRQREWNDFGDAHPTIANIGVKLLTALTRKK